MPEWKRQILDFLKEHGSVTPTSLATALNMNINTALVQSRVKSRVSVFSVHAVLWVIRAKIKI